MLCPKDNRVQITENRYRRGIPCGCPKEYNAVVSIENRKGINSFSVFVGFSELTRGNAIFTFECTAKVTR